MVTQAAIWTSQVENGLNFTGGNWRPRRSTIGVAKAHGSHEKTVVTNRVIQAWCIPSERMTRTVWVASKSPRPNQMEAIHIHWRGSEWTYFGPKFAPTFVSNTLAMLRSYSTSLTKRKKCSQSTKRRSRRSGVAASSDGYCFHAHQSENRVSACDASIFRGCLPDGVDSAGFGTGIYQRRSA